MEMNGHGASGEGKGDVVLAASCCDSDAPAFPRPRHIHRQAGGCTALAATHSSVICMLRRSFAPATRLTNTSKTLILCDFVPLLP
jgi:hypothetical protein